MKRRLRQLGDLNAVTDAVLLAQQSRLAEIAAEEARITALLNELDQARQDRAEQLRGTPDAAARAGADPRWQFWADRRRIALNRELARLRVRREAIREDLARAFGRNEVAGKLEKIARLDWRAALAKRRDHTS